MKKAYVGLSVVIFLAPIIIYHGVGSNKPVIPLQGQVTTAGFWERFLTCPQCVFAPHGKVPLVLWNLGTLGHKCLMLAWCHVQARFLELAIINTSLDVINEMNILSDFTTTFMKVFGGLVFFLSTTSCVLTYATTFSQLYMRLCVLNWKTIARSVFGVVVWYSACAYFYGEHEPAPPVERPFLNTDLTTSTMKVAVGTAVTGAVGYAVGYCFLWLFTQGD
jgi:hypothetical protein